MAADSPTKQQVESPLAIGKLLSGPTDTEAHKPESRPKERRKDDPVRVALETGAQADPTRERVGRKLLSPAAYPVSSVSRPIPFSRRILLATRRAFQS